MYDIQVRVCGDHWLNPMDVLDKLNSIPIDKHIVFDFGAEGPSLQALGFIQMLNDHCANSGRNPATLNINNWPNTAEELPYRKLHCPNVSHFFWMSEQYRPKPIDIAPDACLFGVFVGRRTIPRTIIMWQIYQHFENRSLFSLMDSITPMPWEIVADGTDLEKLDDWLTDTTEFKRWWGNPPVNSLDHARISDQYDKLHNTNLSLLNCYHQFDIEIVCETYTRGNTFFPTEKTIRPILAGKPMLVYGPKHHLARLRDLGFQTWHTVWDEGYDQLEGPERWNAMLAVMNNMCNQDQQWLRSQCTAITAHNQVILEDIIERYKPGC